ncbi:MAG: 50S ribosomal protein L10 [Elusimicrobiota bacterium]|jgi:large subunit ribosomal protein L10|nr:50S ribosomal protein L10 [Elusimicrobiota bacterium]
MPNVKNKETVKELSERFKGAKGLILTRYQGLSVLEISELRSKLRAVKSEYAIVKNTLSDIAFKEMGIDAADNFNGPTAVVFEAEDIIAPAKVVSEFAKTHDKLKISSAFMDGKFVGADIVMQLATLPSREVLIAQMLGSMNAPISGFVNVLAANIRGLLTVLNAIGEKQSAA